MNLTLPYPPSVNRYWRALGRGRVVISKEGREYRESVARAVGPVRRLGGRLQVWIRATMPDRRNRDLDNLLKATLDALQHAGAYEDDSQIDELRVLRGNVRKPGGLWVRIEEIEPFDSEAWLLEHY